MFTWSYRAVLCGLIGAGLAAAQQSTAPAPAPAPPAAPSKPPAATQPGQPGQQNQQSQPPTPIYITGNVVLADGSTPPERVIIERICASHQVRFEGYTDSRGDFGIQLGVSQQLLSDASNVMFIEGTQGFGSPSRVPRGSLTDIYFDCELRARLSGYTSSTLMLAGRKPMDPAPIGTLTLFPAGGKITGSRTISATSAAAPKDARKAFEKGLDEAKKGKYDKAEVELRKSVDLHPRYAEAWTELAKVFRLQKRLPEARAALAKAFAADPNYAQPYEQLYQIAFEQEQWSELVDSTQRLLSMNPYDFPQAFYFNGVAHYQLQNYESAETSLAQAIKADKWNANPKTHYVLGLVFLQQKKFEQAMQRFQTFAQLAPKDPQAAKARAAVAEIEQTLQR